jgi:hypothetical protein
MIRTRLRVIWMGIRPVLLARDLPLHGGVDVDIFQAMDG